MEDLIDLARELKNIIEKTRQEMKVFNEYREAVNKTVEAISERLNKIEEEMKKDREERELLKTLIKKVLE